MTDREQFIADNMILLKHDPQIAGHIVDRPPANSPNAAKSAESDTAGSSLAREAE